MDYAETGLTIFRVATPIALLIFSIVMASIWRVVKKILRQVKYTDVRVVSMDYALESTMNNGYKTHRDHKLKDMLTEDSYINQTGTPLKI